MKFVEFAIANKLSAHEKAQIKSQAIREFQSNPSGLIQEARNLHTGMQQIYQLTEPVRIALGRQALIAELHKATMNLSEAQKPILIKLINTHSPVLAYDPQTNSVFTENNFQGLVDYIKFTYKIAGKAAPIENKNTFRQQMIEQFPYLPLEQKQSFCATTLMYNMMQASWNQMTPQQRRDYKSQFVAQNTNYYNPPNYSDNSNSGGNAQNWTGEMPDPNDKAAMNAWLIRKRAEMNSNQACWNMMQNMSLQNHATSMNIIENIGGGNNYWEVTNDPW